MKQIYGLMIGLVFISSSIEADIGKEQKHIVKIVPDQKEISAKSSFVLTFDKQIVESSVKRDTIVLEQTQPVQKEITGNTLVQEKTLTFSPSKLLQKGMYTLKVKPLELLESGDTEPHIMTGWQRLIAKLCGFFYDDISECPLCQYFCFKNDTVKTKAVQVTYEVKEEAVKVVSIESNMTSIILSEHNSTNISITAKYDDNTTEDVTKKASYTSSDKSVNAQNGVITSHTEGSATVTVSYGGKTIGIQVEVYEMIEGHLLPHEPKDPDDTLLGVDANNNGVRDEVERWIYKEMPTYHHPEIERVVAMMKAKAHQMALIDPANKNDEVHIAIERASDCWSYYSYSRYIPLDGAVEKFGNNLRDKSFNTKERLKTYMDYDYTLKGRVFTSVPLRLLNSSYCDQNIDVLP